MPVVPASLHDIVNTHKVVVCVGPGGVGKTTTAAALSVSAAMQGRRVLCITIDPARRLATSLGFDGLNDDEQAVPKSLFTEHGLECQGQLYATMLNAQQTFDRIVRRYASSPARADSILGNPIYKYIASSLPGTQEYMAMEKLHELRTNQSGTTPRYDLIVLDTPPTANAIDFLDAPDRLVAAIDSPPVQWMVSAIGKADTLSLGLMRRGAQFVFRALSALTGAEFLNDVAKFVAEFNDLFGGFRERASRVRDAMRANDVAFVVVTTPEPLALDEAKYLERTLREKSLRPAAFIVNQVHQMPSPQALSTERETRLRGAFGGVDSPASERLTASVSAAVTDAAAYASRDLLALERYFERNKDDGSTIVRVPRFDVDVHDLPSLVRVANKLMPIGS